MLPDKCPYSLIFSLHIKLYFNKKYFYPRMMVRGQIFQDALSMNLEKKNKFLDCVQESLATAQRDFYISDVISDAIPVN